MDVDGLVIALALDGAVRLHPHSEPLAGDGWLHPGAGARVDPTPRARELAATLAATLRAEFGARRVWRIGSLARGRFGPRSDIDLVAEGIPPARLFAAGALAQRLAGDVEVDLAPLEDLRPPARAALEREGGPL